MRNGGVAVSLGSRVRELREGLGMSQDDLAKLVDVERTYISHIETGRTKLPSLDVLRRLAAALQTPVSDLIGALLGGKLDDSALDPNEQLLLNYFRNMTDEERDSLIGFAAYQSRRRRRRQRPGTGGEDRPEGPA